MGNIVTLILGEIDGIIQSAGQVLFSSTVLLISNFVYLMFTLLIVILGLNMALGIFKITMKESLQIIVRMIFVIIFGLTWNNFDKVYLAATEGTQAIALSFFAPFTEETTATTATEAIDKFGGQMAQTTDDVAKAVSSYFRALIAFFLNVILAFLMGAYVIIVGASKIVIAFLIGIAPFAILCTVFDKTKNIFEGWLTTLVANLLYPIVAAGIVGTIVAVAKSIFTEGKTDSTLGDFMAFIVLMLAGAMAIMKIPAIAQGLTGSFGIAGFSPRPLAVAGSALGGFLGATYAGRKISNKFDSAREALGAGARRADLQDYGGMTRLESKKSAEIDRMKGVQQQRMRDAAKRDQMRAEWRNGSGKKK